MNRSKTGKISGLVAVSLVIAGGLFVTRNPGRDPVPPSVPSVDRPEKVAVVGQGGESTASAPPLGFREARAGITFASLIGKKSAELKRRNRLAARRVRYARAGPDFVDPKTSPFLDAPKGQVIDLELFSDVHLPVVLEDTEVLESGVQLIRGRVQGHPDSRFLMTVSEGGASLSVDVSSRERYLVDELSEGIYQIQETDSNLVPPCPAPLPVFLDADVLAARAKEGGWRAPDQPSVARAYETGANISIDLLVVYTDDLAKVRPATSIRNKTELAVAEANGDLERSGSRVRLRLVHLQAVDYVENGSNSDALGRIRRVSDGHMDEVHAIRDQVGADVVCLLQEKEDSSSSGIAYVMTDSNDFYNESFGFSVVEYRYLTGFHTLVHEVGHNLGCQHDRDHAGSEGLFSFSYGYRFVGGDGATYRTIMAYRPGNRISYFSTPLLSYGSALTPIGIGAGLPGEADNVESLNRGAFEVSNYRLAESDSDPTAKMINVSTRATVGTGDEVLIGGFAVGAGEDKTVLIRALGPSLERYGVRNPLSALKVTLFQDGVALAENSGWRMGPDIEGVVETGFAPQSEREPAILMMVAPGLYSAVVESTNGVRGVSLVEVYETGDTGPHLVNLSTRGYVGVAEEVLIGGFVIGGRENLTKRILIRALGPSLTEYGVSGTIDDPAMSLYDESGNVLLENDDWDNSNQKDSIAQMGYAPKVRRESAMLLDLAPGLYTVVVRPFESTGGQKPGVGLIEAYEIEQE